VCQSRAAPRRPALADVFDAVPHLDGLSGPQLQAVAAIQRCRTAALGGHVWACDQCGHRAPLYNSCRNRHCPSCQALDAVRWAEARRADLLPVPYFHVVFTVPPALHGLFRANPRRAYGLLFTAVAATLKKIARNPKRLGAQIGLTAVLHTWTQRLAFHPHVHCVVTGGGLSPDGQRWIASRPKFFLPVKILSEVFRGKLLKAFERGLACGELRRPACTPADALRQAARPDWVVYAKPPFARPDDVVAYFARYTHRIAISNDRLVALKDGRVTFRWRDRADGGAPKRCTMEAVDFARQFLQHVLPQGFVRIRHYGLLANPVRRANLARCRALLGAPAPPAPPTTPESWIELVLRLTGRDVTQCSRCRAGHMAITETLPAAARAPPPLAGEVAA